jgi:hypothetical protein
VANHKAFKVKAFVVEAMLEQSVSVIFIGMDGDEMETAQFFHQKNRAIFGRTAAPIIESKSEAVRRK